MPSEGVGAEQKAALITGVTRRWVDVLDLYARTHQVLIEEVEMDNRRVGRRGRDRQPKPG